VASTKQAVGPQCRRMTVTSRTVVFKKFLCHAVIWSMV